MQFQSRGLLYHWDFVPSPVSASLRLKRLASLRHLRRAPQHCVLKQDNLRAGEWIALFLYCPTGTLSPSQSYTLERLNESSAASLIVCAAPQPSLVPALLANATDVLIWKSLGGYDFSAYSLGLQFLAQYCRGSNILCLNDSVFGPFVPFDELWEGAQWDLSGFTGASTWENHIQSYAFQLRNVTCELLANLGEIFRTHSSFDHYAGVVLCQETRLAAMAARHVTVGSRWFAATDNQLDPTLHFAFELLEARFPFLKKSLLTKHNTLYPTAKIEQILARRDHPAI